MNFKKLSFTILVLVGWAIANVSIAQTGDRQYTKIGWMDGNQIRIQFYNHGEVGYHGQANSGEWPIGSGRTYVDGLTFVAADEAVDVNGDTIYPLETMYREGIDYSSPPEQLPWGWAPLPGYDNPHGISPATSDSSDTWPEHWPNKPTSWDGYWNGYFGRGVKTADLETYFVMDDDPDEEWAFYPDSTDTTRRGLGLQVEVRGYQWDNKLLEDCILWHYTVKNEGATDYQKVIFANYTDNGIGGTDNSSDDCGKYDAAHEMVYAWDGDGLGDWDGDPTPGYLGYIVLQSPGNPYDGIDNDGDGMIDESMDDGIDNDGDWNSATDDVGADGVAGTGDEGEGDAIPTHGEPNFDETDKDECDQIGPSFMRIFATHDYELRQDEKMWDIMSTHEFDGELLNQNLVFVYGSGPFPLPAGKTDRFCIAMVFGENYDDLCRNAMLVRGFYNGDFKTDIHDVSSTYPIGDETINGTINITWIATGEGTPLAIDIYYSSDDGDSWNLIAAGEENDGTYSWNTSEVSDGIFYRIRVVAYNEKGIGIGVSESAFTINNTGAANPEVGILSPASGDMVSGTHNITWIAGDADGDSVTLNLYYSNDGGDSWTQLSEDEPNDGVYPWNTTVLPNGPYYQIKAEVSDGVLSGESESGVFEISNFHTSLTDTLLTHVSGYGGGKITINVVDSAALTGHTYEITFDDTTDPVKTYDVYDLNTQQFVVEDADEIYGQEGPLFDGIRLWIEDTPEIVPNYSLCRWIVGNCNYLIDVRLNPTYAIFNKAYPADYEIRLYDSVVDTSANLLGLKAIPTNFLVWNVTGNVQSDFLFFDKDQDSLLTSGDAIIPVIYDASSPIGFWTTWEISFAAPSENPVAPSAGDIAYIYIWKPFTSADVFRFNAVYVLGIAQETEHLICLLSQNYPNPFNLATTIRYQLPKESEVSLKIYNILGQEVRTLVDQVQRASTYAVNWNGKDNKGRDVASGLYFYRIQVGHFKQTQKMILMR